LDLDGESGQYDLLEAGLVHYHPIVARPNLRKNIETALI